MNDLVVVTRDQRVHVNLSLPRVFRAVSPLVLALGLTVFCSIPTKLCASAVQLDHQYGVFVFPPSFQAEGKMGRVASNIDRNGGPLNASVTDNFYFEDGGAPGMVSSGSALISMDGSVEPGVFRANLSAYVEMAGYRMTANAAGVMTLVWGDTIRVTPPVGSPLPSTMRAQFSVSGGANALSDAFGTIDPSSDPVRPTILKSETRASGSFSMTSRFGAVGSGGVESVAGVTTLNNVPGVISHTFTPIYVGNEFEIFYRLDVSSNAAGNLELPIRDRRFNQLPSGSITAESEATFGNTFRFTGLTMFDAEGNVLNGYKAVGADGFDFTARIASPPPAPIPLPAAGPIFVTAVALLGWIGGRRSSRFLAGLGAGGSRAQSARQAAAF